MTILVTGATGFIGRHLLAELTSREQPVLALMRSPDQLSALHQHIDKLGGQGSLIESLGGNLDQPGLGIERPLPPTRTIVHLGAAFAWGLHPDTVRTTNVEGALAVAKLAKSQGARLMMISGFMLENTDHLARLGIQINDLDNTDWKRVYRKAGAYEASKLEGALRVRAYAAQHHLELVEIQPATVSGHSETGDLTAGQPFSDLIGNLSAGRLAMVPGGPDHWLPLVSVDGLAKLITQACIAENVPQRLLALDPATPNLMGLLERASLALGRKPPRRYIPIGVLGMVLRLPGMARLMNTAPESLNFLQTTRFSTQVTEQFSKQEGITPTSIEKSIDATVRAWMANG